jgi:hypothetical protein
VQRPQANPDARTIATFFVKKYLHFVKLGETTEGMDETTERNLTPAEVVKRWRETVNEETLAAWRSRNYGPRWIKPGRNVLYPESAILEWEAERSAATLST